MKHAILLLSAAAILAQAPPPAPAVKVAPEDLAQLREGVNPLTAKVGALSKNPLIADIAIYEKAVQNLLKYNDEFYAPNYLKFANDALAKGLERAEALAKGAATWTKETGRVIRAYKSKVDDSYQPYKLSIPANYDPAKPIRLDVILHGRNARLTEASFLAQDPKAKPYTQDWMEIEVYGRGNNAFRWSGETDVFEALEAVVKQYNIDPDRILLRGFSMAAQVPGSAPG